MTVYTVAYGNRKTSVCERETSEKEVGRREWRGGGGWVRKFRERRR